MALARVKTWSSGEVLTASDLNAEFNNIINNPVSLISPLTALLDLNGLELVLDLDADTSITADTDDQIDFRMAAADQIVWTTAVMAFNEQGADINFRVESDTNVNAFFLDAGLFTGVGAIGLAAAATDAAVVLIDNPALTATANTNIAKLRLENTAAITVPAGTTAIAASLSIDEPNITATGTVTVAATVYIEAAPSEGGSNYALWVDSGAVKFDGALTVDGNVSFPDGSTIVGSSDTTKKVRFEVDGLTTATTRVLTVQDEDGTLALTSEFDYANVAGSSGRVPFPAMHIQGLTYAAAVDTDHDTTIAVGEARDDTDAHNLILASALTKQIDAAWAVGTNAGGLDGTESVAGTPDASTWYFIWLIKRSDTGVVDALYSESSTSPTMPTNYDFKRLVGAVRTDSSANIVAYNAYEIGGGGLEVWWDSPTLDVDLTSTLTTSRRSDVIKVPTGFSVLASVNINIADASGAHVEYFSNPDTADLAPSATVAPLSQWSSSGSLEANRSISLWIRTDTSAQISARSTLATVDNYRVSTLAWQLGRR